MNNTNININEDLDGEIDLLELWNIVWNARLIIITIICITFIISVYIALTLPKQYKATAILVPASTSSSSTLSKLASQFGGLASLAGLNIAADGANDKSTLALEIIKTWGFIDKFITKNNLQMKVFAVNGWDSDTNVLLIDDDIYDISTNTWIREHDLEKGESPEPSSWELYESFIDRLEITTDANSGIISISFEYFSPIIAKEWVELLVKEINMHLQTEDRAEAKSSIEYLQNQINNTNLTEMKSVFYQLIQEQTQNLMLTEISPEYVLKTISPPRVPEEESKPNKQLIVALGLVLGVISSIITVILFNLYKSYNNK